MDPLCYALASPEPATDRIRRYFVHCCVDDETMKMLALQEPRQMLVQVAFSYCCESDVLLVAAVGYEFRDDDPAEEEKAELRRRGVVPDRRQHHPCQHGQA